MGRSLEESFEMKEDGIVYRKFAAKVDLMHSHHNTRANYVG